MATSVVLGLVGVGTVAVIQANRDTGNGAGTTAAAPEAEQPAVSSPCDELAGDVVDYLVTIDDLMLEALESGAPVDQAVPADLEAEGDALLARADSLGCSDEEMETAIRSHAADHRPGEGMLVPLIADEPAEPISQPDMELTTGG